MIRIVSISASPSAESRTHFLVDAIGKHLVGPNVDLMRIQLRELPADELLGINNAQALSID